MKKSLQRFAAALCLLFVSVSLTAQNADKIIYNQYQSKYDFIGGSFVIDTGISQVGLKRAFLIWANNLQPDTLKRFITLSEHDPGLNFLTEQGMPGFTNGNVKTLFPKKIIKSKYAHVYYLLAYVLNSNHPIINSTGTSFLVNSSPVIYKIDGNTLNPIWVSRIHLSNITPNNIKTIIEYNDIIETSDKNLVLAGKYAKNANSKESVLATKLDFITGGLIWYYYYNFGQTCNESANSLAETTDGKLSLTGYVRKCTAPSLTGSNDAFYAELKPTGAPVIGTYQRYFWPANLDLWADKITLYTASSGNDRLIISGYIDIPVTGTTAFNRQILIMNVKQTGGIISTHHIGDPKPDVANDLIVQPQSVSPDYVLHLTGQTDNYNSTAAVTNEAYYLQLKFNANTGVTALTEFSTFPVTTPPFNTYRGRTGIEIKNAGLFRKFAILTNGRYRPVANATQTYTDVLIRDFADISGSCIKQFQPPVTFVQVGFGNKPEQKTQPPFAVYKEDWIHLGPLKTEKLCKDIQVDPSQALTSKASVSGTTVRSNIKIAPNPVKSMLRISTLNGESLTGKSTQAEIRVLNASMQVLQTVKINKATGSNISLPAYKLNPGIYFIQLISNGEISSAQFIKE